MWDNLFSPSATEHYWWRSRVFRISLAVFVGVAVILLVLFSRKIGDLLESFGTKAAVQQTLTLNGSPAGNEVFFFESGYAVEPTNSIKVEDGKLMLNPVGGSGE